MADLSGNTPIENVTHVGALTQALENFFESAGVTLTTPSGSTVSTLAGIIAYVYGLQEPVLYDDSTDREADKGNQEDGQVCIQTDTGQRYQLSGGEWNSFGTVLGALAILDTVGSGQIDAEAATNAKLANMAQATIKGRADGAGTGAPVDLTATQARAILNVEDGAEANPSGAEIKAAYEAEDDTNALTDALLAHLNAIEAGAQVNPTNAETKTAYEANSDTNALTDALLAKLNAIEAEATANSSDATLLARANHTGEQAQSTITGLVAALAAKATPSDISAAIAALTKSSVGLGNVDNTSDANKPVSTAQQAALDAKATPANITSAVNTQKGIDAASGHRGRPGEYPDRFTATLTGAGTAGATAPGSSVTTTDGTIRRLTGAAVLGLRERVTSNPDASYKFTFSARRSTDPTDPAGDTVRFGIQCLDEDGVSTGQITDASLDFELAETDNLVSATAIVASDDTPADIDFEWPSGTVSFVPFIQTYGSDGVTDAALIDHKIRSVTSDLEDDSVTADKIADDDLVAIAGIGSDAAGRSFLTLSDPDADKIAFWNDGTGATDWLGLGTGISISSGSLVLATGATTGIYAQYLGGQQLSYFTNASNIASGTIDVARLPAAVFQAPVVSSGDIADLTSLQQDDINEGSDVTTTDGKRWTYSGSGSKTDEASYVLLSDVTPAWSAIADKPVFATVATSGDYDDLSNTPVIGTDVQAFSAILQATTASFTEALEDKIDGIEAGAQVNPTNAETKTAYEANSDTNAYTDAEKALVASATQPGDFGTAAAEDVEDLPVSTAQRERINRHGVDILEDPGDPIVSDDYLYAGARDKDGVPGWAVDKTGYFIAKIEAIERLLPLLYRVLDAAQDPGDPIVSDDYVNGFGRDRDNTPAILIDNAGRAHLFRPGEDSTNDPIVSDDADGYFAYAGGEVWLSYKNAELSFRAAQDTIDYIDIVRLLKDRSDVKDSYHITLAEDVVVGQNADRVLSGVNSVSKPYIVRQDIVSTTYVSDSADKILFVPADGQSNSVGGGADANGLPADERVYITTPPLPNDVFTLNDAYGVQGKSAAGALVAEDITDFKSAVEYFNDATQGETGHTAGGAWLHRALEREGKSAPPIIVRSHGAGGRTLARLMKEPPQEEDEAWNNGMIDLQKSIEIAAKYGKEIWVPAVDFCHGFSDRAAGTDPATYKSQLITHKNNYATDWGALLPGDNGPVEMILDQLMAATDGAGSDIPIMQLEACRENADMHMSHPRYFLPMRDGAHHTHTAQVLAAEYRNRVRKRLYFDGGSWLPNDIDRSGSGVVVDGRFIHIPLTPPSGRLVVDTKTLPPADHLGFEVLVDAVPVTIAHEYVGKTSVTLALPDAPSGDKIRIRYAYEGPGATGRSGAWGNIRDDDSTPSYTFPGTKLWNWLVMINEEVNL